MRYRTRDLHHHCPGWEQTNLGLFAPRPKLSEHAIATLVGKRSCETISRLYRDQAGRTGGLLATLNLTKARWDEDIHCIIHANPKRGKTAPGWPLQAHLKS